MRAVPRRWTQERRHDPYYRAAQREGLRSRASFKLIQLQDRFHLIPVGASVLDLGASPGGWSLVARELVGKEGRVTAVDQRSFEPLEGVEFFRGRVGSPELAARLAGHRYDAVLSDMSPSISGNYSTDHARSIDLVRSALALALTVLEPRGTFVAKVFDGDMTRDLLHEARPFFLTVTLSKPGASRGRSSEIYLIARGFRSRSTQGVEA